jgi:hypothetical protein
VDDIFDAFEDVEALVLRMMNVERRPSVGRFRRRHSDISVTEV